jgi:hypothetical protein
VHKAYYAEAGRIIENKLAVGGTVTPIIRNQKEREAIEQHDDEGEDTKLYIELTKVLPQVSII